MSEVKAILTTYKGIEFRSRLEARWAVFFDACGVDWEYEPEGFELPDGTWYLPDFLLHDVWVPKKGVINLWVEVKGEFTDEAFKKVSLFCGMFESWEPKPRTIGKITRPIIVLNDIPQGESLRKMVKDVGSRQYFFFNYMAITGDFTSVLPCITTTRFREFIGGGNKTEKAKLVLMPLSMGDLHDIYDSSKTYRAYQRALSAKFEHGETPPSTPIWEEEEQ